jgi:hypothetical protein
MKYRGVVETTLILEIDFDTDDLESDETAEEFAFELAKNTPLQYWDAVYTEVEVHETK